MWGENAILVDLDRNARTNLDRQRIVVGDFNLLLSSKEKRGGSKVRDPLREKMEDLISNQDLIDVIPKKGCYTLTNQRVGPGHIAARLDKFLIHSDFLLEKLTISSHIIVHGVLDH